MAEKYYYNTDRKIILSVDPGKSEAHLLIEDGIPFYSENQITTLINQAEIVSGFDTARDQSRDTKQQGKAFLLAKGMPLLLPKGNFSFFAEDQIIERELLFSDKLELKDLEYKAKVRKGSPIATFYVTDSGRSGHNIFGNIISLPENKIALCHLYSGENVLFDEETGQYIATADGYIYLDAQNRLSVRNQIELAGDVFITPKTLLEQKSFPPHSLGDYEIWCNLLIQGNLIGPGNLRVKGDLSVRGMVNNCTLYVEGVTVIREKTLCSTIISLNSIEIYSASNSRICSGNDLLIEKMSKDCLLVAEMSVLARDKNVLCNDCSIYAGKIIMLNESSYSPGKESKLVISIAPFTKELIAFLKQRIVSLMKNPLVDKDTLMTAKKELKDLKEHLMKRYTFLDYGESSIKILKKVSAGTYIRIFNHKRVLDKGFSSVDFYIDKDKLISQTKVYIS